MQKFIISAARLSDIFMANELARLIHQQHIPVSICSLLTALIKLT